MNRDEAAGCAFGYVPAPPVNLGRRRHGLARVLALMCVAVFAIAACGSSDSQDDEPGFGTTGDAEGDSQEETGDGGATSGGSDAELGQVIDPSTCSEPVDANRTDLRVSGNRVADGSFDLASAEQLTVDLGERPIWVLPFNGEGSWYVALESGVAVVVDVDGSVQPAEVTGDVSPPEIIVGGDNDGDGQLVSSAFARHELFDNPLPDTRVVQDGAIVAALVNQTDRYAHGILGDELEAAAVQLIDLCTGERVLIEVSSPDVIESLSPILADVDGDGATDVLVTLSNGDVGARLVAYRLDGSLLAESDPIGLGNRWRNQLGVAPLGPDGELEIVDVRIPHIGGVVEYLRVDGERLERVAAASEFTTHVIRTRNLDMGIIADGTGDGRLDVVVLTQDRTTLAILERSTEGVEVVTEVDLGSPASTNIAPQSTTDNAAIAVGTAEGKLLIWAAAIG